MSFISSDTSNQPPSVSRHVNNPNSHEFELLSSFKIGNLYLVEIRYLGCTDFEGRKLLVMDRDPSGMTVIDPHFTPGGYIVAKFAPDKEGKQMGIMYLKAIQMKPC